MKNPAVNITLADLEFDPVLPRDIAPLAQQLTAAQIQMLSLVLPPGCERSTLLSPPLPNSGKSSVAIWRELLAGSAAANGS